jgi:alpha-amylase
MMRRSCSLAFIVILTLVVSCTREPVNHWPNGVNYEVFVLSFADGNGDGKGDFKGLTSKLDYFSELGVGGLWLMPIMNSPSYHKYDVTDYKSIHPDYGTTDDFRKFVEEAHKRNIRVLVDLILNHTGSDHPWFQAAIKDKKSKYRDYYVWAKKDSVRGEIAKKQVSFDSDNITQWHPVNGDTLAEHYYGFFWGGMPDLNFDNPAVRAEFADIGKFWLTDMNVDGFRLDAAKHIYPTDQAPKNHEFWVWFRDEMQKIKPDVYLVGEVWSKAEDVAPYLKGLPALFNFDLGYAITAAVQTGRDTSGLIKEYKKIIDFYNKSTSDYIDATFLKNHDQNRILSELNDDEQKARVATSILMTLPGTPYVYYGEEIGMKGKKPDEFIREPFIWDKDHNDPAQTTWEEPRFSTEKTVVPLATQKTDKKSVYNFYHDWIEYRNDSQPLTYGSIELAPVEMNEVVMFFRVKDNEKLFILHNISDVEVTVPIDLDELYRLDYTTNPAVEARETEIVLPAYSTAILKN